MRPALWIIGLFLVLASGLSRYFPPIHSNEVVLSVIAWNMTQGDRARYSINDDVFSEDAYVFRDLNNHSARPLADVWQALWAALLPHRYWTMRMASMAAAGLALAGMALAAANRFGPTGAWMAVLWTLAFPGFWMGSVVVNECMTLLAAQSLLVAWAFWPSRSRYRLYGVGAVQGLLVLIHPAALPAFLGLGVWKAIETSSGKRRAVLVPLLLGGIAGLLAAVAFIDWTGYLRYLSSLYSVLIHPPLLDDPLSPWKWFIHFTRSAGPGPTEYFDTVTEPMWTWGYALFGTGALAGAFKSGRSWGPWCGTAAVYAGLAASLGRQEILYSLILLPFLVPALVRGSLSAFASGTSGLASWPRVLMMTGWIGGACAFAGLAVQNMERFVSPPALAQAFKQLGLESDRRLAGPNILWFVWNKDHFRDAGALVVSRYFTEGRWDLRRSLGSWRPDYLVADRMFRRVFLNHTADAQLLSQHIGRPVRRVGGVDAGPAYGQWDVFEIRWNDF